MMATNSHSYVRLLLFFPLPFSFLSLSIFFKHQKVWKREALLARTKAALGASSGLLRQGGVAAMAHALRHASLDVADAYAQALYDQRPALLNHTTAINYHLADRRSKAAAGSGPYLYRGRNYIAQMATDLNFFAGTNLGYAGLGGARASMLANVCDSARLFLSLSLLGRPPAHCSARLFV
jgi:hypothetical protein